MLLDDKIKLLFDGTEYEVKDTDNLVELMDEHGVNIIAPCYRNGRRNGCCKVCIVEVDGIKDYACGLKPEAGMKIIYNRDDLKQERKIAAKNYATKTADETPCCESNETKNADNSCCNPRESIQTDCDCNSDNNTTKGCC